MADYNEIKNDAKTRMEKSLESLKADFGGLRAGRAHASLLDGILVEAYGSMTPLGTGQNCRQVCRAGQGCGSQRAPRCA